MASIVLGCVKASGRALPSGRGLPAGGDRDIAGRAAFPRTPQLKLARRYAAQDAGEPRCLADAYDPELRSNPPNRAKPSTHMLRVGDAGGNTLGDLGSAGAGGALTVPDHVATKCRDT